MPTLEQAERNLRVAERKLRELEGKLAAAQMAERQRIEADAKPKRPPICTHRHKVYDQFSWPWYWRTFIAPSDWRPSDEDTLRRVREARRQASLR